MQTNHGTSLQQEIVVFQNTPYPALQQNATPIPEARKKVWKESVTTLHWGGQDIDVIYPTIRDPRVVQIGVLTTVNILGQVLFHFHISVLQILTVLLTSILLDVALTYKTKHIILFPASGFISGLSMAFLLQVGNPTLSYAAYLLAGFLAILSKHVITLNSKHIFNPSNFAIVCLLLLFPDSVFITPDEWNASFLLLLPILFIGTRLIMKAKVTRVALTFILTEVVLFTIFTMPHHPSLAQFFSQLNILLFSPSLLIFTFFMITDPITAPKSSGGKNIYAFCIALFHWIFLLMGMKTIALFLPLFITCCFVPGIDWLWNNKLATLRFPSLIQIHPFNLLLPKSSLL